MKAVLTLGGGLPLIGGVIAALVGQMWDRTAKVLRFFGKDVGQSTGFKIT
jgi:hypothetical protein